VSSRVSCLVADDHPALTSAVTAFLAEHGYDIVGPASNGSRAVALAAERQPDVALLDLRMPRLGGRELIEAVVAASPATRIAVYTADADHRVASDVLAAGAVAIVLKEAPLADLVRALDYARAGRAYVDPALVRTPAFAGAGLTERELEVLSLVAEGIQHEEIGALLGISGETVRTHVRKACDRLGASTRTQAVATALRLGLIA
jgi:DNA-binding NarL/FixJ family response regulator